MALTAAQIAQTYRILEVPQDGNLTHIYSLGSGWYDIPIADTSNHSTITATIDARLAALSASNLAQMVTLLTREALIQFSQVRTKDTAGSIFADHIDERAEIRKQIEDIIGIRIRPRFFQMQGRITR